jgi:hypothetical protein
MNWSELSAGDTLGNAFIEPPNTSGAHGNIRLTNTVTLNPQQQLLVASDTTGRTRASHHLPIRALPAAMPTSR